MQRRVLNVLAGLSLLLCMAALALWARSHIGKGGRWSWLSQSERYHFDAIGGQVNVGFRPEPAAQPHISYWETTLAVTVIHGTMAGGRFVQIIFPLWMPAFIFSAYPLIRGVQWYRRPKPAGLCSCCGYDLRASADRCPECGALQTGA